jgi:hypothetical protein
MGLRMHVTLGLIGVLGLLASAHATSAPGHELDEAELSGTYAAGLDLDIERLTRRGQPEHGSRDAVPRDHDHDRDDPGSLPTSVSARELARAIEGQLPWSQKQAASTAAQATVRTAQAMATITQMLPLGVVFLPTIGLPLVPPQKQSSSQH